jgi:drug/metabolite transporter (DMT)-like permease
MLFWGLSFIWSSVLLRYYQPVTIIFVRLILSTAFLFTILWFSGMRRMVARRDYGLLILSAFFNPFLYFLCENYGLKLSSPTVAAVIIATIPLFSPLIAFFAVKERLTLLNLAGIVISFFGVVVMLITRDLSLNSDVNGVLFLFGAVVSALFFSVLLKKLTNKYSALMLVAWQNLIGIFLFFPIFLIYEAKTAISIPINSQIISSFLLLSILASSAAFVLFAHTVKLIGVSKANIYSNLIPVFTAFFSYFLIGESFTIQKTLGILLVIGGVFLSERTRTNR